MSSLIVGFFSPSSLFPLPFLVSPRIHQLPTSLRMFRHPLSIPFFTPHMPPTPAMAERSNYQMRFPVTYKTLKYNEERERHSRDDQTSGYGAARARGSHDCGYNDWGGRRGSGYNDRGGYSDWWQGNRWGSSWDDCDWWQDPYSRRDSWSSWNGGQRWSPYTR